MNHLDPSKLVLSSSISDLHYKLFEAQTYAKNSEYDKALEIYLAFEKLSDEPFYKIGCATMYQLLDAYDEAISYCNKLLQQQPNSFEGYFIKGTCLGFQKENNLAINSFKKALTIKNDEQVYYNLGVLYMSMKEYSLAINAFQSCLEIDPRNVAAHLNLGIYFFDSMLYEESLIHYNKALEIKPNFYQAYGRIGEYEKAIENFEICLLLDSKNYQALYGIAFSMLRLNRVSEATIYYKIFITHYRNELFKNQLTSKALIVDIGYEKTIYFIIHLKPNHIASIQMDDLELQINLSEEKSYIFIGAPYISDNTGSMQYATIGKIYTSNSEYQQTVTKFKEKANLFQYFDQPIYIDFESKISVNVTERNKNILIDILIDHHPLITGITDGKTGGLETFIEHFNKYGQFRLHFETPGEVFVIDGLKNINLTVLKPVKK